MSMALLLVADELANRIFWPNTFPIAQEKVVPYLKTKESVDTAQRAYSSIIDLVNENAARFTSPDENAGQVWGIIMADDTVLFNKSVLIREMQNMGYNFDSVKKKWKDRGFLILNSQGRFVHQTTVYGAKGNYIKIKMI